MNKQSIKDTLTTFLKPYGKAGFLKSVVKNGKLLDVGCGNNSPLYTRLKRPDIDYIGLDIGIYNQAPGYEQFATEIILTTPENFDAEIEKFKDEFDAIISSHNLEHCNNYQGVLLAMINALKKNGKIYLAFPCEESTTFPSRSGCLNFFDDNTHKNVLPFSEVLATLKKNNVFIDFAAKNYKPAILASIGFVCEPLSRITNRPAPWGATWAFYGFESIIVGHKL